MSHPMAGRAVVCGLAVFFLAAGLATSQLSLNQHQAVRDYITAGTRLMRAGDHHGAISQLRHAVRIDGRSEEAYDLLGWCYLRTSQLRYAVGAFNSALTVSPGLTSSRRGLGLAYFRLGRHQECVRALRPVIDQLGADEQVQYAYGSSLLKLGEAQAALPHLRAAEARSASDPSVLIALAEAHMELGELGKAELYYDRVLQLEPNHSRAQYGLLGVYQQSQRHLDTRQLLRKMLADNPNDPVLLAELAKADQALGLKREAMQVYERLTRLVEGDQALDLHLSLAEAYMKSGQPSLARPHYQEAVGRQPQDPKLRAALADCLVALGQREEAAEQYQQAARLQPTEPAWQFRRGKLLAELGRGEEALEAYQAGLALDPENEFALAAIADLARELDRPELARDALIQLAAARPNVVSIRLALSDTYRELDDIRAADVQAWEVLRQEPDSVEARYRLAKSAEQLGDFDGAIEHLEAIQRLDPTRTVYLAPLGRLLAAQGRLDEAVREYELLLERDPQSMVVKSDLAALYIKSRQLDKARGLLVQILAEKPASVWALDRLARCEELAGRIEQAIGLRREVATTAPTDTEYLEALVRLYERAGRAQEGTDFLVTLLAVPDPPPAAVRTLVGAYRRQRGDEAALEQIRGLAAIFKHRPVFQLVAAEFCATTGLRDEAIQRYARYLRASPGDYGALTMLVALCRDEGDLERARRHLAAYCEQQPTNREALRELARLSLDDDRLPDAFAAASRVVELQPSDPAGYRLLADVLARLYSPTKAVEVMLARSAGNADPAPQVGLAYAYVLDGRPEKALSLLAETVETHRTEAEAAYVRGVAKHALGLHDDAVVELARAAAGDNVPADYRATLAATLAVAGRAEDALWEYARLLGEPASEARGIAGVRQLLAARAIAPTAACDALGEVGVERGPSRALIALLSDPLCREAPAETIMALNDICDVWRNSEMAADALAAAYQVTGQPDEEARVLSRLVDMRPANVAYQLRLARAHERAHALSRAADAYAMALAFDPQNHEAAQALDRILADEHRIPAAEQGTPVTPTGPRPLTPPPSSTARIAAR